MIQKFQPSDVIAVVVICACTVLLSLGVDGIIKGALASVTAHYFVKKYQQANRKR